MTTHTPFIHSSIFLTCSRVVLQFFSFRLQTGARVLQYAADTVWLKPRQLPPSPPAASNIMTAPPPPPLPRSRVGSIDRKQLFVKRALMVLLPIGIIAGLVAMADIYSIDPRVLWHTQTLARAIA